MEATTKCVSKVQADQSPDGRTPFLSKPRLNLDLHVWVPVDSASARTVPLTRKWARSAGFHHPLEQPTARSGAWQAHDQHGSPTNTNNGPRPLLHIRWRTYKSVVFPGGTDRAWTLAIEGLAVAHWIARLAERRDEPIRVHKVPFPGGDDPYRRRTAARGASRSPMR